MKLYIICTIEHVFIVIVFVRGVIQRSGPN